MHQNEAHAAEEGLILLDEFKFPHAIFQLAPTEMNADGLNFGYKKLENFLNMREKQHLGLTLIVTPQWMFMSTLQQPYYREQNIPFEVEGKEQIAGIPIYLDGFAFSGIVNL